MSTPRCPECRGPVEKRGNTLLCMDRASCRTYPSPHEVIFQCPKCGEDAWLEKGSVNGEWKPARKGARILEGTATIGCVTGHRVTIPLPDVLQPRVPRRTRSRRAF